ncbi:putative dual-specificity kinase TKL-Pl-4 family [Helianthus annuus]|nr:putative dual-specificity kinase TKL-Pl-4 family [Helianthus annuus]
MKLRHGEKKTYNHKVDGYSFAIVLWEFIHNKLPFEGMPNLQAAYAAAFKNVTSCWKEALNARPNFTQIIQMLHSYLSASSPQNRSQQLSRLGFSLLKMEFFHRTLLVQAL